MALSDTVRKIEGKCASVKGDLAEMAMSEQYLRTKQAMLLAKKKETEMKIAQNIASLREAEVLKMKEKVKHMQVMIMIIMIMIIVIIIMIIILIFSSLSPKLWSVSNKAG